MGEGMATSRTTSSSGRSLVPKSRSSVPRVEGITRVGQSRPYCWVSKHQVSDCGRYFFGFFRMQIIYVVFLDFFDWGKGFPWFLFYGKGDIFKMRNAGCWFCSETAKLRFCYCLRCSWKGGPFWFGVDRYPVESFRGAIFFVARMSRFNFPILNED